jgi:hypothetical protein
MMSHAGCSVRGCFGTDDLIDSWAAPLHTKAMITIRIMMRVGSLRACLLRAAVVVPPAGGVLFFALFLFSVKLDYFVV